LSPPCQEEVKKEKEVKPESEYLRRLRTAGDEFNRRRFERCDSCGRLICLYMI